YRIGECQSNRAHAYRQASSRLVNRYDEDCYLVRQPKNSALQRSQYQRDLQRCHSGGGEQIERRIGVWIQIRLEGSREVVHPEAIVNRTEAGVKVVIQRVPQRLLAHMPAGYQRRHRAGEIYVKSNRGKQPSERRWHPAPLPAGG